MTTTKDELETATAPTSARLSRFREELERDPQAAVSALRRDLEAAQGPLVEPIDGQADVLVTFVHFADARRVKVECELWPWHFDPPEFGTFMERVPGTDVWYASVEADPRIATTYQYQVDPPDPFESLAGFLEELSDKERQMEYGRHQVEASFADPFNPNRIYPKTGLMGDYGEGSMPEEKWESVLVLPDAEPFTYLDEPQTAVTLQEHTFTGRAMEGTRTVSVYLPPGYTDTGRYPIVVFLDGDILLKVGRIAEVLQAAITAGDLPPLVAVFWHNLDSASRVAEMTCNFALSSVLSDELLPWLRERYALTDDPSQVVISGISLGGLASALVGLERADAFGCAFPMSPSLWNVPADQPDRVEWLIDEYRRRPTQPLKLFISVGSLECNPFTLNGCEKSMVELARSLKEVGLEKGYDIAGYREHLGGHDLVQVQRVLQPGLSALLSPQAEATGQGTPQGKESQS